MIYTTGFIIINQYFDTRRARAMGLASLGMAAGGFIFPPLVQTLFDSYGFQGTFVLISAMMCNIYVSAALYRPLKGHSSCLTVAWCNGTREVKSAVTTIGGNHSIKVENITECEKCIDLKDCNGAYVKDEKDITTEIKTIVNATKKEITEFSPVNKSKIAKKDKDVTYEPSVAKIHSNKCAKATVALRTKVSSSFNNSGFFLLKDLGFAGFSFLSFSVNFMLTTATGFVPALAVDRGINHFDAALLLSVSGAANMAAVLPFGWLMDLPGVRMRRPYVYAAMTLVVSVTLLSMPLMLSFAGFAVMCSAKGAMAGVITGQKVKHQSRDTGAATYYF